MLEIVTSYQPSPDGTLVTAYDALINRGLDRKAIDGLVGLSPPFVPGAINLKDALAPPRMDIDLAESERRIAYALSLGYPNLGLLADIAPPGSRVMVIGGGPSIAEALPRIREQQARGVKLCAVNISHEWLFANGIKPDFAVMLDPAERVAEYQTPTPGVIYIIGTTVCANVWRRFRDAGIRPFVFVPVLSDDQHQTVMARYPDANPEFVSGATTVSLRTVNIMRVVGFQDIELAGVDSCHAPLGGKLYAYDKPHIHDDTREITIRSAGTGRRFKCRTNGAMARQILGFFSMIRDLDDSETNGRRGGVKIFVSGDGAIPWMAWLDGGPLRCLQHTDPEAMQAKYGDAGHWDYHANEPLKEVA